MNSIEYNNVYFFDFSDSNYTQKRECSLSAQSNRIKSNSKKICRSTQQWATKNNAIAPPSLSLSLSHCVGSFGYCIFIRVTFLRWCCFLSYIRCEHSGMCVQHKNHMTTIITADIDSSLKWNNFGVRVSICWSGRAPHNTIRFLSLSRSYSLAHFFSIFHSLIWSTCSYTIWNFIDATSKTCAQNRCINGLFSLPFTTIVLYSVCAICTA